MTDKESIMYLMRFVGAALGIGAPLLAVSTVITPDAPFVIAALLFGLTLPARVLTHREAGGAGVRALLRDCVRLPISWWWLPLAGFGFPSSPGRPRLSAGHDR